MRHWSDQSGLTLIELLVTVVLTVLVFGLVLTSLDVFQRSNRTDQLRNEAQDNARSAIDRLSQELRNVAAPSKGSAGALEEAAPYSLMFQTVSSSQVFGGENKANQMRVRYCLDASTATNETLWREAQTWTSVSAPNAPSTAQCPSAAWSSKSRLASYLTNEIGGQTRPLFYYNAPESERANIKTVEADLFLNIKPSEAHPGETEIKDGILLRNSLGAPIAHFSLTQVGNHQVLLDASSSRDPNGQALSYQWYLDASPISGATSQQYETRSITPGSHTFNLTVTDTAGLSASEEQTVTIK